MVSLYQLLFVSLSGLSLYIFYKDIRLGLIFACGFIFTSYYGLPLQLKIIPLGTVLCFLGVNSCAILYALYRKRLPYILTILRQPLILCLFLIAALMFAYSFLAEPRYGIKQTGLYVIFSLLPVVAFASLGPYRRKDVIVLMLGMVAGSSLMALFIMAYGDVSSARGGAKMLERYYGGNIFSAISGGRVLFLAVTILGGLFVLKLQENRLVSSLQAFVCLGLMSLYLYVGFALGTRGPILATFVAALGFMLLVANKIKIFLVTLSIAIFFLIVIFVFADTLRGLQADIPGLERVLNTLKYGDESGSFDARIGLYQFAWENYTQSSGIGVGTGGFGGGFFSSTFDVFGNEEKTYPHNFLLELAAEQGTPGLVVGCFLMFFLTMATIRVCRDPRASGYLRFFAILWIFGFINASVSGNLASNSIFFVLAAFPVIALFSLEGSHVQSGRNPNFRRPR
jgi:hypothetical protein